MFSKRSIGLSALVSSIAAVTIAGATAFAGGPRFVDVVVSLDRTKSVATVADGKAFAAEVARQHGVEVTNRYGQVLVGFSGRIPESRLQALRNDPLVDSVNFDRTLHIMQSCNSPNTPPCEPDGNGGQSIPWGVDRVDADLNANTGAGTHVYIVDTGIDATHPDLQANLGNGNAFTNCQDTTSGPPGQRMTCDTTWDDDHGHGSHVAGTVGAIDNDRDVVGVAPDVTLHAVKVCTSGGSCATSDIIGGIDWAASETVNRGAPSVLNMSLGGPGSKTGTCDGTGFTGSDNFHQAVCNAANDGVVIAVAAGNDSADAENFTPAAYDDAVITVSATNDQDDWAGFSNYGDNAASWDNDAGQHAPVALAAPGVDILSTWNDGSTNVISGTSMASPHVAGGAALYITTNAQSLDYSAFTNTRNGLLAADESTDGFANTTGLPHDEDFLDAENL